MKDDDQIRQGDVLLIKKNYGVTNLEKIAENKYTLVYGETTGHSHVMKGDVAFYNDGNGQVLCQVHGKTELVHEEHDVIEIPDGEWLVIRQREFDLIEGIRKVSD